MDDQVHAPRMLLVDDEEDFLEPCARALARRGFEVSTAPDAFRAFELLERQRFEVAILDVKMPWIDGVELFHELQQRNPELPVIMLTGHGTVQEAFQTSREGVFDYLSKPCDMDRLAQVARRAVETPAAKRRIETGTVAEADEEIRLLLIDDEEEFLAAAAGPLARRGMQIHTATDGPDALALMARQAFDVVVLDVRLPGMDGLEVLRRIQADHADTEVILLTGHPSVTLALDGIRLGAFDYLIKPQQTRDLVQKIKAAYARRKAREQEARERRVKEILEDRPD